MLTCRFNVRLTDHSLCMFDDMDDPELEQFVLEKSSSLSSELLTRPHSSGSSSSGETMDIASPQTPVSYSHIIRSRDSTEGFCSVQPAPLTTTVLTSPVETLSTISHFSANNSAFETMYPQHGLLRNEERVTSIENHISESHLFDLNGNHIPERYSVPQLADYTVHQDQDFENHCQSNWVQGEYCNYNMGHYSEGMSCYSMQSSSPEGIHDSSYYSGGYTTQASFDSDEDSFEVEYFDHKIQNNIQNTQIVQPFINSHSSASSERCPLPNFAVFTECKKVQNRRGRPVTYNKPGCHFSDSDHSDEDERNAQSKGCRRGAKNILLWKFLLGELRKPNNNHIKWENEREGIFKFVDTAECSRLWGQMKKKEDMNFEKLSRGIRHYYRAGLMSRRAGIRLVYKFNWECVPRAYWPRVR